MNKSFKSRRKLYTKKRCLFCKSRNYVGNLREHCSLCLRDWWMKVGIWD